MKFYKMIVLNERTKRRWQAAVAALAFAFISSAYFDPDLILLVYI